MLTGQWAGPLVNHSLIHLQGRNIYLFFKASMPVLEPIQASILMAAGGRCVELHTVPL